MITGPKIKAAAKKLEVADLIPETAIQAADIDDPRLAAESTYYPYRAAVAQLLQPAKLAFFGLRFGYTALAMLSQCEPGSFWSWDDESAVEGSTAIATTSLIAAYPAIPRYMYYGSIEHLARGAERSMDLVYMNAGKTEVGTVLGLRIATRMTSSVRGHIVLDDANTPDVAKALVSFMAETPFMQGVEIKPDDTGLVLITWK